MKFFGKMTKRLCTLIGGIVVIVILCVACSSSNSTNNVPSSDQESSTKKSEAQYEFTEKPKLVYEDYTNKNIFFTCEGVNKETGEFDFEEDVKAIISLPTVFNSSTTNRQVLDEDQFEWKDVQSVGAYFTYYMEIEGVPTATTLSISFKLN